MSETTSETRPKYDLPFLQERVNEHLILGERELRELFEEEYPELCTCKSLEELGALCTGSPPPGGWTPAQEEVCALFVTFVCEFGHFFRDVRHEAFLPVEALCPDFPRDIWAWVQPRTNDQGDIVGWEALWLRPERLFYLLFPKMLQPRRVQGEIYDRARFDPQNFNGTYDRGANDRAQIVQTSSETWIAPDQTSHPVQWRVGPRQGVVSSVPPEDPLASCGLPYDPNYTLLGLISEELAYILEVDRIHRNTCRAHESPSTSTRRQLDTIHRRLQNVLVSESEKASLKYRDNLTERAFFEALQSVECSKKGENPHDGWTIRQSPQSWIFAYNRCYSSSNAGMINHDEEIIRSRFSSSNPQSNDRALQVNEEPLAPEWFVFYQMCSIMQAFSMGDSEHLTQAFLPFGGGVPSMILDLFRDSTVGRCWQLEDPYEATFIEEGTVTNEQGETQLLVTEARRQDILAGRLQSELISLHELCSSPLMASGNSLPSLLDSVLYEAPSRGNNDRPRIDEEMLRLLFYWSVQPNQFHVGQTYSTVFSEHIHQEHMVHGQDRHVDFVSRFLLCIMGLVMAGQSGRTNPLHMMLLYVGYWVSRTDLTLEEMIHELCSRPFPRLISSIQSQANDLNLSGRYSRFVEHFAHPDRLNDHPLYLAIGLAMIALYKRIYIEGAKPQRKRTYLWNDVWAGALVDKKLQHFRTLDDVIAYWLSHADVILARAPKNIRGLWEPEALREHIRAYQERGAFSQADACLFQALDVLGDEDTLLAYGEELYEFLLGQSTQALRKGGLSREDVLDSQREIRERIRRRKVEDTTD